MLCGVDEAGRGPVLGPLVVAGVAVPRSEEAELVRLGVRDSKRLTPKRRETLSRNIKDRWKWEIRVVKAEDIDVLREEMTLNVLEAKIFASVLDSFSGIEHAYIDAADVNEEGFATCVASHMKNSVEITSKHGADDVYPVVSAASIVAKVERDRHMALLAQETGKDVGSGYPSDARTVAFLDEWVAAHGDLPPQTRRSWKTAQRILRKTDKKLEDYGV